MSEKNILKEMENIIKAKEDIKKEIENEIKRIFKKCCGTSLYYVEFNTNDLWIHLRIGTLYSTELFSLLDTYFGKKGNFSYSDGDGFVICYDFR